MAYSSATSAKLLNTKAKLQIVIDDSMYLVSRILFHIKEKEIQDNSGFCHTLYE